MKNEAKLKNWGLEKGVRYYYLKFGHGAVNLPDGFLGTATVCVIGEDSVAGWHYVRGVSFCNPRDQFVKKTGRAIALGRAIRAIESRRHNDYIKRTTPADILNRDLGWIALSAFNVALTEYEKKMFEGG